MQLVSGPQHSRLTLSLAASNIPINSSIQIIFHLILFNQATISLIIPARTKIKSVHAKPSISLPPLNENPTFRWVGLGPCIYTSTLLQFYTWRRRHGCHLDDDQGTPWQSIADRLFNCISPHVHLDSHSTPLIGLSTPAGKSRYFHS